MTEGRGRHGLSWSDLQKKPEEKKPDVRREAGKRGLFKLLENSNLAKAIVFALGISAAPETVGFGKRAESAVVQKQEKISAPKISKPETAVEQEIKPDERSVEEIFLSELPYRKNKRERDFLIKKTNDRLRDESGNFNKTRFGEQDSMLRAAHRQYLATAADSPEIKAKKAAERQRTLELVEKACVKYGVPLQVALGVAEIESYGSHYGKGGQVTRSEKNAFGIFQVKVGGLLDAISADSGAIPDGFWKWKEAQKKKGRKNKAGKREKIWDMRKAAPLIERLKNDRNFNIDIGVRLLAKNRRVYTGGRSWAFALAMYHQGVGNVAKAFVEKFKRQGLAPKKLKRELYPLFLKKAIKRGTALATDIKDGYPYRVGVGQQLFSILQKGEIDSIEKSKLTPPHKK
ncbi:hypothetical protein EPN28_01180 [Patescibacteria group bacterium]|nr:MAG: hypothetical protein EPN28_01180 [Patescibacteria group bacterium]